VDVSGEQEVVPEPLELELRESERLAELPHPARAGAAELRGDEEEQLVDQLFAQERGCERRPALEEQRLHALAREPPEPFRRWPGDELELRALRERPAPERQSSWLALRVHVTGVQAR
jgi:hypothetical protein